MIVVDPEGKRTEEKTMKMLKLTEELKIEEKMNGLKN